MNSELAMSGLVILFLVFCFAIIWFFFMVPMEQGLHKRRVELIQRKLQANEERLRRQREEEEASGSEERCKEEAAAGKERKRAGGAR